MNHQLAVHNITGHCFAPVENVRFMANTRKLLFLSNSPRRIHFGTFQMKIHLTPLSQENQNIEMSHVKMFSQSRFSHRFSLTS